MQNLKLLIGVVGGTLVLVFAVAFLFSSQETTETTTADASLTEADRRHVRTSESQPTEEDEEVEATESSQESEKVVTIVEFSDFQCPACRAASPLIKQAVANNPGKVELLYRHFPLESIHKNAKAAASASEVIAEQGLFWEFHDVLFENQPDWSGEEDPTELFIQYATDIGANVEDLESKLSNSTYADLVEDDIKDGFALGVNSTPTIYVDGEQVNAGEVAEAVAARL